MILTKEQYETLFSRIQTGEFLQQEESATVPPLPDKAAEMQSYREQCQQTLDLYQSKTQALQAQLNALRRERENDQVAKEADAKVADFNDKLEEKYRKLQEKYADELRNAKKALEDLQTLSDSVLEENKRLKEKCPAPEVTAPQVSLEETVNFCIEFVSNIDEVADRDVDVIKRMVQKLVFSPLGDAINDPGKLDLFKRLSDIEKIRKQQANQRKERERQEEHTPVQHNDHCQQFFAPVDKSTFNNNKTSDQ